MSPKVAIPVLIGALVFAPAAFVAQKNQVRLHAFAGSADIAAASARVASTHQAAPSLEVGTVFVRGALHRQVVPAVVRDAQPVTCQPWRKLRAGPRAAHAVSPMVRACDAPPIINGSDPAPGTARNPPAPRPPPAQTPWRYEVDLGAPR